ncbi:MAG: helix-turn-helix transcriptional regulator [Ruminococcaceae bacterium]|nr:helix-turn-helix transcriptional regulator [Oscillospiraceae bacterium]
MASENNLLGDTIRSARIRRNYTQDQLAELLNITTAHLKHIENGRRNPSVPLLFQMMELLTFSVDALVFPAEQSHPLMRADGLTKEEISAIEHLIEVIKSKD